MSILVMNEVWQKSKHSGSELLLLLALADHASDNGGDIYPSQKTMAAKTRMSDRQIRRILNVLQVGEYPALSVVSRPVGGVVQYRINVDNLGKEEEPIRTGDPTPDILSDPGKVVLPPGHQCPTTPDIATSDKPSVNRPITNTTTNVVGAAHPKVEKKEDDFNVYFEFPDEPTWNPEDRAAALLVRYNAVKGARERLGVLGEAFTVAFGQDPTYNRLAALRSKYGVEPLAAMIYRLGGKDIVGDPMDYLTATLNKRGMGPNGWTPRMAWHPAGYRSAVPDDKLTVSELWIKYPNEGGIPHVIVKRKRDLERRWPSYMVFERRAHLAYAQIARPDWIESSAGKELLKQYGNDYRRCNPNVKSAIPEDWKVYCDKYVPEEIRDQVREIEFS